ncbi:alpha/beta fold hydrolase [Oceaniglobus roseus]|uniref:alpha/beta fold hydrolase n=1 Tax=Oceaniglobus roseus TaxID=1737570 RepID=UPI000C7F35B0|nr:alpha/beta fold hydrolase [Kandeliimicrobium roseum]
MGLTTLTLPRLGETMEEAKVTGWLVPEGQPFNRGDVLLEVETDKTVVEVPALKSGTMVAHLVREGDTVALDAPIAEVEAEVATPNPGVVRDSEDETPAKQPEARSGERPPASSLHKYSTPTPDTSDTPRNSVPASPRARRLAARSGVTLESVEGTGRRGRITGEDVARAVRPTAKSSRRASDHVATPEGRIALRRVASEATGTPVLLLHGLYDHGRGWRDLPDRIARAGHPVLVPDLPGHGQSDPSGSLESATNALLALLPEGRVILAGHSLGAVLATRIARRIGPRAARLVLFAPAGLGPRINADFLDGMAHAETPEALARAFALLDAGPMSATILDAELARLRATRQGSAALARAGAQNGLQQSDIASDLAQLACPTAAVFGLGDRIINWQDCAALPARTAIHLVADAGHLPHFADPGLALALLTGSTAEDRAA